MNFDFLTPVSEAVIDEVEALDPGSLGHNIAFHTTKDQPELTEVKIAIIGVCENRRETDRRVEDVNFDALRLNLYALYPGNWSAKIVDLGDILPGETTADTTYALKETLAGLLTANIIPLVLGGSQDLTYSQYRAYDSKKTMVNLVSIDSAFDIGNNKADLSDTSYIGKMIVSEPYNLSNYANLGYQAYMNAPQEIDLMERLFFEAYRLGNLYNDIGLAEPVLRDADLVSLDLGAVTSEASQSIKLQPNGFNGREICALARYAGISDNMTSFGLYGIHNTKPGKETPLLAAEILWYVIEGVNFRKDEQNIFVKNKFIKYSVPLENEVLIFYKSKRSGRWWIKIPIFINNKLNRHTFLPCSHQDYLAACNQEIPERWYKARRRNEL